MNELQRVIAAIWAACFVLCGILGFHLYQNHKRNQAYLKQLHDMSVQLHYIEVRIEGMHPEWMYKVGGVSHDTLGR